MGMVSARVRVAKSGDLKAALIDLPLVKQVEADDIPLDLPNESCGGSGGCGCGGA